MREILFRGFHPCDGPDTIVVDGEMVNGAWVQGSLVSFADGGRAILPSKAEVLQQTGTTLLSTKDCLEVLPSTVGEYTGLTDKNGKRIFEGDRLKWDEEEWEGPHTEEVKWDYDLISSRKSDWEEFCEVIGTVFDEEALDVHADHL